MLIKPTASANMILSYAVPFVQGTNSYNRLSFQKLPHTFPYGPQLPLLDSICLRIAFLAGFKPELYDCCPNLCCCYTGPHKDLTSCLYCKELYFCSDRKPWKRFTYIPLISWLIAFAGNLSIATKMQYQSTGHEHMPGQFADVFDGSHYCSLQKKHVELNGEVPGHKCFADSCDIALSLLIDGFAPFKRQKSTA